MLELGGRSIEEKEGGVQRDLRRQKNLGGEREVVEVAGGGNDGEGGVRREQLGVMRRREGGGRRDWRQKKWREVVGGML